MHQVYIAFMLACLSSVEEERQSPLYCVTDVKRTHLSIDTRQDDNIIMMLNVVQHHYDVAIT